MEELLAIFCDVDDFCKDYEEYCQHHLLMNKEQIVPKTSMSLRQHRIYRKNIGFKRKTPDK